MTTLATIALILICVLVVAALAWAYGIKVEREFRQSIEQDRLFRRLERDRRGQKDRR